MSGRGRGWRRPARWCWNRAKACAGIPARLLCRLAAAGLRFVPAGDAYAIFRRHGFHLLEHHYYLPVPDESEVGMPALGGSTELPGVDLNEAAGLALLEEVLPRHLEEFRQSFPDRPGERECAGGFHWINGGFMAVDAHVYYALIRHGRPRRVIEIGAGWSTLLAAAALERNRAETGRAAELTAIDPEPADILRGPVPGLSSLVRKKVQEVDPALFAALEAGDILFLDSSHVLREGGDVQHEYCEILPRLAPGVLVHAHDISLPRAYPRVYFDNRLFWNEQYLLQAFLAFNSRFEVLWAGNHLLLRHPDRMRSAFPEIERMRTVYPLSEPTSLWMRVRR